MVSAALDDRTLGKAFILITQFIVCDFYLPVLRLRHSAGQFRRPTQRLSISSITVALFASMMARSGGICSVVS